MEEEILATIKNENNEQEKVKVLIDEIEITEEMENELSNNMGEEE